MFFHSWAGVGHVVLSSVIVFSVIVTLLRVVGQQALAKMSACRSSRDSSSLAFCACIMPCVSRPV
jgi:hypothetical protein